jgi:hypothetical protein
MLSKKDFGRGPPATLLQGQHRTRKIDSRDRSWRFDSCAPVATIALLTPPFVTSF